MWLWSCFSFEAMGSYMLVSLSLIIPPVKCLAFCHFSGQALMAPVRLALVWSPFQTSGWTWPCWSFVRVWRLGWMSRPESPCVLRAPHPGYLNIHSKSFTWCHVYLFQVVFILFNCMLPRVTCEMGGYLNQRNKYNRCILISGLGMGEAKVLIWKF